MYNFKYLVGGAALLLTTSALAGGPEVAPAPVVDNSGFYVNVNGGLSLLGGQYNTDPVTGFGIPSPYQTAGWNAGGEIGYHWNSWRVGISSNYFGHSANSAYVNQPITNFLFFGPAILGTVSLQSLQLWDVMANGYYDFDLGNSFVPYVGLGLGWAGSNQQVFINILGITQTQNFNQNYFAAQAIVGVAYKITDNFRVDLSGHAIGLFAGNRNINGIANNSVFRNSAGFESQINLGLSYFF